ncbi:hypothetical protein J6W34_03670 [bacterium]|nr:hypothetical protein [bacterium]
MKYSYVFEDKNNDGLQELRQLGEKWYELYLKNQTTISDMEKLKNQKTIKTLDDKMFGIMKKFNMNDLDIRKAFEKTISQVSKDYGLKLKKFGGMDYMSFEFDIDNPKLKENGTLDKSAYKNFGTKLAEYVMLYHI